MVPKMKFEGTSGDKPMYSKTEEAPYSVEEIATKVKRSTSSVLTSLYRLEGRNKAKEVAGGWMRKER
jgi:predicted Rossmann fold nucleotide-binding protein DprA/Smf involved in DNA uptake